MTRVGRIVDDVPEDALPKALTNGRYVPWWIWLAIAFATIGTSFAGVLLQNEVVVDDADPETA